MKRRIALTVVGLATATIACMVLQPTAAEAQPFGSWTLWDRPPTGYVEIPHSPALNPTGSITIEGWVAVSDPGSCGNIIGKNWQQTWWVGICGTMLRSYLRGSGSFRDAGTIGVPGWTHFAVTFDGTNRCHYINGEEIQCWIEPGPLPTNTAPVRIGSDVAYAAYSPEGAINELRLWNVARSEQQIRSTINVPITSPMPGLVAVWAGGGPTDVVGPHDGSIVGTVPALTFPVTALGCSNTPTSLCAQNRFVVTVDWRVGPPDSASTGVGQLAPLVSDDSGVFWFFDPANWELLVKVLDACIPYDHFWVFSAATTNVFYRLEVLDTFGGANKVYFNYPGPPAPAVTDTIAFSTCP